MGARVGPAKKRTNVRTTNRLFAEEVARQCKCKEKQEQHVELFGHREQLRKFQNYPGRMAAAMAKYMVLATPDEAHVMEEAQDELENIEHRDILKELRAKFSVVTIRTVAKLHEQFGHPAATALAASLKDMQADEEWIACAALYVCEECLRRQRPRSVRVVSLPRATYFNEIVETDVFQVMWRGTKRFIMSILDENTRFEADAVIRKERAALEIKVLEKIWLSWAGPMKVLRLDMSGSHMSAKFKEWADRHGIRLDMVPKNAHHRLGILERNHQVR